jgi:glycosyltransferase involved in cell wall biosynthesis
MRILLLGLFDGEDVGEAWVGYQWARRLAERHDVTLVCWYKRDGTPISRQLPGARVIEWQEPPLVGKAERLNSMLKPAYVPYYLRARRWIRASLAAGEQFDLAFQPFPVAMRYPSPAAGLGIPFIMGPVGGSLPSPPGFGGEVDTAPWYVGLRRMDALRLRYDRLLRDTYEQASCVIGIAPYVREALAGMKLRRFEVMSETGIDSLPEQVDRDGRGDAEVRMLFVGRVIRTKGVRDAIRALGIARDLPAVLDIVGDGFDRTACESLTAELGLTGRVRFHGKVDRSKVDDFYRAADIFVFPSYREPGGNVVYEAMGYGLPLIVGDNGGPGTAVDDTSGVRVHPGSPDQYAADIAAAMTRLVTDRQARLALGAGARRRVAEIALWDNKVKQWEEICAGIVADHAN